MKLKSRLDLIGLQSIGSGGQFYEPKTNDNK